VLDQISSLDLTASYRVNQISTNEDEEITRVILRWSSRLQPALWERKLKLATPESLPVA
jgi:hypothetical protein